MVDYAVENSVTFILKPPSMGFDGTCAGEDFKAISRHGNWMIVGLDTKLAFLDFRL